MVTRREPTRSGRTQPSTQGRAANNYIKKFAAITIVGYDMAGCKQNNIRLPSIVNTPKKNAGTDASIANEYGTDNL